MQDSRRQEWRPENTRSIWSWKNRSDRHPIPALALLLLPSRKRAITATISSNDARVGARAAREFSRDPQLLIADKPTSGLDIGSQEYIRRKLMEKRDEGKAILLISEDLDEVLGMSDRIAIMYEGRVVDVVQAERVSKEEIGEMITGLR